MNQKDRSRILLVFIGLLILLLSLVVYLSYIVTFKSDAIAKRPENRRRTIVKSNIKRGSILDRDNNILAYSEAQGSEFKRIYNEPTAYSHIIGYSSVKHGDYLLEKSYRDYLLGEEEVPIKEMLPNLLDSIFSKEEKEGGNLILTTNTSLQKYAHAILSDTHEKGAIVAMDPKTGEVLAMASLPEYNSSNIDRDLSVITEQNQGALLNRATSGLYSPGSIYKIITSAALLENPGISQNYDDTGEQEIDGRKFKNALNLKYGKINLKSAFVNSVNTYFVQKTVEIGQDSFGNVSDRFWINQDTNFDLPLKKSAFDHSKKLPATTLAASGIGQGNVLVTPLEMAMVASTIANEGKMMKPYLVQKVVKSDGNIVHEQNPEVLSQAIDANIANQIKEYMIGVVREGTGKNARVRGIQVAGKTGTAETSTGLNNAWFVGFAPANEPKIAVCVLLEGVDKHGGEAAAPLARDLINYALKELKI